MDQSTVILLLLIIWMIHTQSSHVEKFCFLGIGDCGSKQKTVNDIVNESISNAFVSNTSSCTQTGGVQQTLSMDHITAGGNINIGGVGQTGNVALNFSCIQNNKIDQSTIKQIQGSIQQEMQQKTSGYQFQPSTQETINNTTNKLISDLNLSQMANCVANSFVNQEQLYSNLSAKGDININNLAQTAMNTSTSSCLQQQSAASSDIAQLQTTYDQKVSQEAKGVDITSIFSSLFSTFQSFGMMGTVASVVCMILCGASCYFMFGQKTP